jgi:hypothetical protein
MSVHRLHFAVTSAAAAAAWLSWSLFSQALLMTACCCQCRQFTAAEGEGNVRFEDGGAHGK